MSKSRITYEKEVVTLMINIYCRKKEKNKSLCPQCTMLLQYAHTRLDHCIFGEKKARCQTCAIHCYNPKMRTRMQQVMRFAAPRMLIYSPKAAIRHLFKQ